MSHTGVNVRNTLFRRIGAARRHERAIRRMHSIICIHVYRVNPRLRRDHLEALKGEAGAQPMRAFNGLHSIKARSNQLCIYAYIYMYVYIIYIYIYIRRIGAARRHGRANRRMHPILCIRVYTTRMHAYTHRHARAHTHACTRTHICNIGM